MALVHDMAEALVGDITPVDKSVTKAEKARREAEVIEYIARTLLGTADLSSAGQRIKSIFYEYEANETLEARFVHDIDKMELLLQTVEYERSHRGKLELSEFYRVLRRVELPEMKKWGEEVMREREAFWADKGGAPPVP